MGVRTVSISSLSVDSRQSVIPLLLLMLLILNYDGSIDQLIDANQLSMPMSRMITSLLIDPLLLLSLLLLQTELIVGFAAAAISD